MFGADPPKIYYLLVLETDAPSDITPFQGFSVSWAYLNWALHRLATLPADVLERSYKLDDVLTQRMGGARPLKWIPINIGALEQLTSGQIGVFTVCFSGEKDSALRTQVWVDTLPNPVLHVSNMKIDGAAHADEFNDGCLHDYFLNAFTARSGNLLMGLLAPSPRIIFTPSNLTKILLLSAFSEDDQLKMLLRRALEVTKQSWEGKVVLVTQTARSKSEFVDAP